MIMVVEYPSDGSTSWMFIVNIIISYEPVICCRSDARLWQCLLFFALCVVSHRPPTVASIYFYYALYVVLLRRFTATTVITFI